MPNSNADETLEFLDVKDVDLDGVLGRNRRRPVKHIVFYDSGYPVERYYDACIENCPDMGLRAKHLAMAHGGGIQQMEQQGVIHHAVQAELA